MNSLFARASVYLVSGLVGQGSTFLLWMILPWLLSPAEIGYVTLSMFAVDFLSMLGLAGMDAAMIRFAVNAGSKSSSLSIALAISGISFAIIFIFTTTASKFNIPFLSNTVEWVSKNLFIVLLAVAANILWSLYQSYQVAAKQARDYAMFQIFRALIFLGCGVGLAFLYRKASVAPAAAAIGTLVALLFFIGKRGLPFRVGNPFRMDGAKQMATYGLPLVLNSVLGVASNYTQRLIIDHYADIATLGVFGFFATIAIQINGFWASFNRAWTPEYFSLVTVDSSRAKRLLQSMMSLVCIVYPLLLALYVVLGESFLNRLVLKSAYLIHVDILYLLLLAPFFCGIYIIAYPLYYYDNKTLRIVYISIFIAAVNLFVSMLMIKRWGMEGAASSFVIQSAVSAVTYLLLFRGWAEGARRIVLLLITMTALSTGAASLLILTRSATVFAIALLIMSLTAWSLSGPLAKPLLSRFFSKISPLFYRPENT